MKFSFSLLVSGIFVAFMLNSIYGIVQLFIPPKCDSSDIKLCLSSFLTPKPSLQLILVTYPTELYSYSQLSDENVVATWSPVQYTDQILRNVTIPLPRSTRKNGTLFMYAFLTETPRDKSENWISTIQRQTTMTAFTELTQYLVPEAKTFNLLGKAETVEDKKVEKAKSGKQKPVAHITKKIFLTLMTDLLVLPRKNLQDIGYMIRIIHSDTYLPPLRFNKLASRIKDFYQMNKTDNSYELELEFAPASLGNMRLNTQFEGSMESMKTFGFSPKDLDDVKGIFLDTNVYLLGLTMFVASIHLLFDFLAFKNEIIYWKHRKTLVGLSSRTLLWRCFSSIVVFLYLLEEKSSLLIIGPSGISSVIEVWKVTKAFKIKVKFSRGLPRISFGTFSDSEKATAEHDVESMKYLSYVLYPLLACGAVYSLLYMPHKSWYSWTVQTMVNGVYCFGFLFMLPQLFVNYRLKSVAHLPWRAFMYKAFNTFIDDIFAFIITMPTAHRIACFRDDIVFIIYLYQRWLYPVDQTRVDAGGEFEIDVKDITEKAEEKKKN